MIPTPRDAERIVLVGFMGAGKTVVGRALARRLGWTFVDTDETLAADEGRTIADIFEDDGEATFRRLERDAVRAALAETEVVVAVGGGAFSTPAIREDVLAAAFVVHLDVDRDTLARRIGEQGADRPLARAGFPDELLRRRGPDYARAHARVDGSRSIDEVVEAIVEEWGPR